MTTHIAPVSNGAARTIAFDVPYIAHVTVQGTAHLLFHAWNCEAVEAKSKAGKNTKAKKSDDIESYVYRLDDGRLGIPGANFHGSLIEVGRSMSDPRSPRKSMMALIRAGISPLDDIAPLIPDVQTWDYVDQRRVTVQRNAITRMRPAMRVGWKVAFSLLINTPEYLDTVVLREIIGAAGRTVGLCDNRPSYGRFTTVHFDARSALAE